MPFEVTGTRRFRANIDRFVELTGIRGSLVMRKLGLDGFAGVLKKSPVDKGRFRGNWFVGVNSTDLSITEPGDSGKASGTKRKGDPPNAAEQAHAGKLLSARWEDEINITNNLPYALPLEFGHSKQAPGANAILGRTFEELKQGLAKAVKDLGGP